MASFVPTHAPSFSNELIPLGHAHSAPRAGRSPGVRGSECPILHSDGRSLKGEAPDRSGLMQFLASEWDKARAMNECVSGAAPRTVASDTGLFIGRYLVASVAGNRFCLNKGASHKSNAIYLVVDTNRLRFRQKCHDPDCAGFKSIWCWHS